MSVAAYAAVLQGERAIGPCVVHADGKPRSVVSAWAGLAVSVSMTGSRNLIACTTEKQIARTLLELINEPDGPLRMWEIIGTKDGWFVCRK